MSYLSPKDLKKLSDHESVAKPLAELTSAGKVVGDHFHGNEISYSPLVNTPKLGDNVNTVALESKIASIQKLEAQLAEAKKPDAKTPAEAIKAREAAIETAKKGLDKDLKSIAPSIAHSKDAHNKAVTAIDTAKSKAKEEAVKKFNAELKTPGADIDAASKKFAATETAIDAHFDELAKPSKAHLENIEKLENKFKTAGHDLTNHLSAKDVAKYLSPAEKGVIGAAEFEKATTLGKGKAMATANWKQMGNVEMVGRGALAAVGSFIGLKSLFRLVSGKQKDDTGQEVDANRMAEALKLTASAAAVAGALLVGGKGRAIG